MLVNNKNYNILLEKEKERNKILSEKMMMLFSNVNKLAIASVGNSISSGYCKCDFMLPLLNRTDLFQNNPTNIYFYNFSRVRKNDEQEILDWVNKNIAHKEINQILEEDIKIKMSRYARFDETQLEQYMQLQKRENIGLKDFIQLNDNIMIYNGLTGSFTFNLRYGKGIQKFTIVQDFRKDYSSLKKLLQKFYEINPMMQIYICGLPNVMNLNLNQLLDNLILDAIKNYPNVIFVEGVSKNFFLKLKGQQVSDIHYNAPEYLRLLNNIFEAIIKNYLNKFIKNTFIQNQDLNKVYEQFPSYEEYIDQIVQKESLNLSKKVNMN